VSGWLDYEIALFSRVVKLGYGMPVVRKKYLIF